MKLADIHDLEIGRLLVRRYPQSDWSIGFEIRRCICTFALYATRLELFWREPLKGTV